MPVALVYPNTYQVGMSSLGFQLVYSLLNAQDDLVCERFFLPEKGSTLRSVESGRPISDFPCLLFSVSFEHDYVNLVRFLKLADIPLYSENRGEDVAGGDPLVVCGGVASFMNPEPLAPFIDSFFIGEAEAGFLSVIYEIYQGEKIRSELLLKLARDYPGCYVPSLYTPVYDILGEFAGVEHSPDIPAKIRKQTVHECEKAAHSELMTPNTEFSNLFVTELGRGCSRGCRFCTAGFIYRPPRLWSSGAVVAGLEEKFGEGNRVGLLGMEMAEDDDLEIITDYLLTSGCSLSFSSLRADRIDDKLLDLLGVSGLKSVAVAPDGSSERLRHVINKGICEQDLLEGCEKLVSAGIYKLKVYLMIGLPTETDKDLEEAIELIKKIRQRILPIGQKKKRLCEIVLSVNSFTPKAWTPFQYHGFGVSERLKNGETRSSKKVVSDLKRKLKLLKNAVAALPNVHMNHDKPEYVLFQAVLARADRRIAPVLEIMACENVPWQQAMKRLELTPEQFAVRGYGEKSFLPWDIIDHKIKKSYLYMEYQKAFEEKETSPCDVRVCRRCGVCDEK